MPLIDSKGTYSRRKASKPPCLEGLAESLADEYPEQRRGSRFLGNGAPALIDQVGETVDVSAIPFEVVPECQYLRAW